MQNKFHLINILFFIAISCTAKPKVDPGPQVGGKANDADQKIEPLQNSVSVPEKIEKSDENKVDQEIKDEKMDDQKNEKTIVDPPINNEIGKTDNQIDNNVDNKADDNAACLASFDKKISQIDSLKYDTSIGSGIYEDINESYSLFSVVDNGEVLNINHYTMFKNIYGVSIENIKKDFKSEYNDYIEIKKQKDSTFKLVFKSLPENIEMIHIYSIAPLISSRLVDYKTIRLPKPFLEYKLSSNENFESDEIDIWPVQSLIVVLKQKEKLVNDQYKMRLVKINSDENSQE